MILRLPVGHNSKFKTAYLSDRAFVEKLGRLMESKVTTGVGVGAASLCAMGLNFTDGAGDPKLEQILQLDSGLLDTCSVVLPPTDNLQNKVTFSWDRQASQITLSATQPAGIPRALEFLAESRSIFGALDVPEQLNEAMSAELRAAMDRQSTVLAEYEAVNLRMANEVSKTLANTRAEVEARKRELENQFKEREEKLNAQHGEKLAVVEASQLGLEQEKRNLDTRESRHARRGLRQDLLKQISDASESFSLTEGTSRKRWASRVACYVGALAFGSSVVASYLAELPESLTPGVIVAMRASATLGFAALLVFYLRWETHWAQRHADEEFYRKRLGLDVNRANWVIEAALEWATERGHPM
ncbi:MAG: hypothetical protein V3W41_02055 [Planctomycetota bacterium]